MVDYTSLLHDDNTLFFLFVVFLKRDSESVVDDEIDSDDDDDDDDNDLEDDDDLEDE
jgi:hypothetical protein